MFARIRLVLNAACACLVATGAQAAPTSVPVVWQHFALSVPAGYCVDHQQGPDFVVRYIRSGDSKGPILAGVYTGHAPNFSPDCKSASKRHSIRKSLKFDSVEGSDSCAEYLVSDPKNEDRGFLHLWFGPDAKTHSDIAHSVVDSIAPAAMTADNVEGPTCP